MLKNICSVFTFFLFVKFLSLCTIWIGFETAKCSFRIFIKINKFGSVFKYCTSFRKNLKPGFWCPPILCENSELQHDLQAVLWSRSILTRLRQKPKICKYGWPCWKIKMSSLYFIWRKKNMWKYIPYQGQIWTLVKMRVTAPAPAQSPIICSFKIW